MRDPDSAHVLSTVRAFRDEKGALCVGVTLRATFAVRPGTTVVPVALNEVFSKGHFGAVADDARFKPLADVVVTGDFAPPTGVRKVVGFALARGPEVLLTRRLVAVGGQPGLVDPERPGARTSLGPEPADGQVAPVGQRISHLRGGEQLLLVGLGRLAAAPFRLRGEAAFALVSGPATHAREVPLVCDTLWLDVDAQAVCLSYRGVAKLFDARAAARVETSSEPWTVRAGFAPVREVEELRGSPSVWSNPARPRPLVPTVDPVLVSDDSGFVSRSFSHSFEHKRMRRVVVVRGTFDVAADGGAATLAADQGDLCGDEHGGEEPLSELVYASDLAPFKPEVDVLVRATAYAAEDRARTSALVALSVGALQARIVALGPRAWDASGTPTLPGPFSPVPLRWENAFGGPGLDANPVGTGALRGTPPPRIEDPDRLIRHRDDRPEPVCFAPVAPGWRARARLLGTYDETWLRERWPHFPADLDPLFFQAAPSALRLKDLSPSASFRLTQVRPGGGALEGRLPGLFPRAFARRTGGDVVEVRLRLDTVLLDGEACQVSLRWCGSIADESGEELSEVVVVRENEASPRTQDELLAYVAALAEPRLAPSTASRKVIVSPEQAPSQSAFQARRAVAAARPPTPPKPLDRKAIKALIAAGKSLKKRDFSDADLRDIDFTGQDLSQTLFTRCKLEGACFKGAHLKGAGLADSDAPRSIWDDAELEKADFCGANLSFARMSRARVEHTKFTRARLSDADLGGLQGCQTGFVGATLERASLEQARLPKADFSEATLSEARFAGAELADAKLYEARAERACFDGASLENARLEGASLENASLVGISAKGSVWERANLTRARLAKASLEGAIFTSALLANADLSGVVAREASLRGADLTGARLDGADLMKATLEDAVVRATSFRNGSLFQAELAGVDGSQVDLANTILAGTKLAKRR